MLSVLLKTTKNQQQTIDDDCVQNYVQHIFAETRIGHVQTPEF